MNVTIECTLNVNAVSKAVSNEGNRTYIATQESINPETLTAQKIDGIVTRGHYELIGKCYSGDSCGIPPLGIRDILPIEMSNNLSNNYCNISAFKTEEEDDDDELCLFSSFDVYYHKCDECGQGFVSLFDESGKAHEVPGLVCPEGYAEDQNECVRYECPEGYETSDDTVDHLSSGFTCFKYTCPNGGTFNPETNMCEK